MPGHRASTLQRFDECPAAYKLALDFPDIVNYSVEMERGAAFAVFAAAYRRAIVAGCSHDEAATQARLALSRESFSAEALDDAAFFIDRFLSIQHPEKGPEDRWLVEHIVSFDRNFNLVPASRDAYYSGAMDWGVIAPLAPGAKSVECVVYDDKTYRQIPPVSELQRSRKMLGYLYGLHLIAKQNGLEPVSWTVALLMVVDGTLQRYSLSREEVEAIPTVLRQWCEAADKETEFAPKPTPGKCLRCPFRYRCKTFEAQGLEVLDPKNAEEAAALAARWATLEAQAEDAKEAVRAYLDRTKAGIPMPDGKTLDLVTVKKDFVTKDAVSVLLSKGIPADAILEVASVNRDGVKKILKRVPREEQRRDIDAAITDTRSETHMKAR